MSCFFHVFHVLHFSLNPTKRSQGNSQTKKVNPTFFLLGGVVFTLSCWEVLLFSLRFVCVAAVPLSVFAFPVGVGVGLLVGLSCWGLFGLASLLLPS